MNQSTLNIIKNMNNSFHTKYLSLCKGRNFLPNHEITKNKFKLEIIADRLKMNEWQMISKSLEQDNSLQSIEIISRKAVQCVREQIDNEKKCRTVTAKGDPLISTKYIFYPLVRSISNCIRQSTEITSLALEGLPLTTVYVQSISNAILQNNTLKMLSFARSNIMDEGCVIICSTIKHLSHIEKINFSYCDLSDIAAVHISDLIKFQTINRYSEEWIKSFRYQDISSNATPGLKCLVLNGNEQIGDKGLQRITLDLKEDVWMKAIEVKNCGITDAGGRSIVECLNCNKTIAVFDVSCNPKMSKKIFNDIQKLLGAEPDAYEADRKESTVKLRETIDSLEQRLEIEATNREQANQLNIQLHNKLKNAEVLKQKHEADVPSGFLLVNEELLDALYKQLDDLKQEKLNQGIDQYQSTTVSPILSHRISQRSGFGDKDAMETIRNNQRMSRLIQEEYPEGETSEQTENSNISDGQDQSTSENDTNLSRPNNKNRMKSVYTMLNESMNTSTDNDTPNSNRI